jgi:hypothetical protein
MTEMEAKRFALKPGDLLIRRLRAGDPPRRLLPVFSRQAHLVLKYDAIIGAISVLTSDGRVVSDVPPWHWLEVYEVAEQTYDTRANEDR